MGSEDAVQWLGREVVDSSGERIGQLEEVYLDRETDQPEWAAVKTGLFGSRVSFVPLEGASLQDDRVHVLYGRTQVEGAPNVDAGGELSEDEEARLYSHYGLEFAAEPAVETAAAPPAAQPTFAQGVEAPPPTPEPAPAAQGTDDAMTRSEEELHVSTRRAVRERVRLRKRIVSEDVSVTVRLQHEELTIEREPVAPGSVDPGDAPAQLADGQTYEILLYGEEPVISTRVVPIERVRIGKETLVEQRQVTEELRKERIDLETEGVAPVQERVGGEPGGAGQGELGGGRY